MTNNKSVENPESQNRRAGFTIRFLAVLTGSSIGVLPTTLFWFLVLPQINTLQALGYYFVLYLAIVAIPLSTTNWILNHVWLTSKIGANIGKYLTGLRVTDEDGKFLTFRRSLFRHTIGYQFSGIIFSLGFLSVIKDKNKQAWHDKAVGSRVWVVQNLWPVSLVLLVALLGLHIFLVSSIVLTVSKGSLPQEVSNLLNPGKLETPPVKLPSSPAPFEKKFQVN